MRAKALYFPYINLPDDDWLYLMLLYWDQLSSILPSAYIFNPEELAPHMPLLMKEGLVKPIYPQEVLHDVTDFGKPFLNYIRRHVRRRQLRDTGPEDRVPIHIEKLGGVADELVDLRLAMPAEYPWFNMDRRVANVFMSYLASVIGSLPEVDSTSVTNDTDCFHLLIGYQVRIHPERVRLRHLVLKDIFPFPRGQITLNKIVKFKEKYGNELARFRNKIESLCIDLSNVPQQYREEQRHLRVAELKDEVEFIAARMRETWHQITFLDILPVLGAGAAVIAGVQGHQLVAATLGAQSLSTAVYQCLLRHRERNILLGHPLAYGAFLKREWSPVKRVG